MTEDSKGRKIGYWATTGLLGAALIGSGIMDLVGPPDLVESMERLGIPLYLPPLLGIAKLLAAAAILAPKFARLKEWAYAGLVIDFIGAAYVHIMSNEASEIVAPLVFLAVTFASWFLRPANRKLPDMPATT
ncbi:hypothetical protein DB30_03681 [Enhygromyxa salina]|uniref:DoxX-like family protein n=1 Tax=Enhygromyxa salina TaxID=215803 RepID=A0A0C1ZHK4_9BACT|nr:DoxX family protein [Enhygromyxa salina]KIG17084.1 hypothetical protein DB30_03681 [Enhygromyxa salina]